MITPSNGKNDECNKSYEETSDKVKSQPLVFHIN